MSEELDMQDYNDSRYESFQGGTKTSPYISSTTWSVVIKSYWLNFKDKMLKIMDRNGAFSKKRAVEKKRSIGKVEVFQDENISLYH